jgi:hypothetical protein
VKRQRIVFWTGLLLYVASFFLIAVVGLRGGETGISSAQAALLYPWTHLNGMLLRKNPLEFFSILISGWINPFFLITIILMSRKQFPQTIAILRIIILLMIPFCWIVFYYEELYPREGHFLWVTGMLLTLFSGKLRKDESA